MRDIGCACSLYRNQMWNLQLLYNIGRTHKVMDGSPLTCKIADGDPRTGTFHLTWVTADDTACSVNGVYYLPKGIIPLTFTVLSVKPSLSRSRDKNLVSGLQRNFPLKSTIIWQSLFSVFLVS